MTTDEAISKAIEAAKAEIGEPVYRYEKKYYLYNSKQDRHWTRIGHGEEVEKQEYDENIKESNFNLKEAFMERLNRHYWKYSKRIVQDGWKEYLIKALDSDSLGLKREAS